MVLLVHKQQREQIAAVPSHLIFRSKSMNIFYVYAYLNPLKPGSYRYGIYHFSWEPIYIGKGKNGRDRIHLNKRDCSNPQMRVKMNEIKNIIGIDPVVVRVWESLAEKDALYLEIEMIKTIGRKDLEIGPLLNMTNGGEAGGHSKLFILEHPYISEPQIFNSTITACRFCKSIGVDYNNLKASGWSLSIL